MPRNTSTHLSLCVSGSIALAVAGCVGSVPPPDWRILRAPPVMTDEVIEEAVAIEGTDLSTFVWSCDAYGSYIDELRLGSEDEDR